jgi:hypothetical protein
MQLLKQRLKERLDQREKSMIASQDRELQDIISAAPNKTAAKIKRMMLIHKHMVNMEKFRYLSPFDHVVYWPRSGHHHCHFFYVNNY